MSVRELFVFILRLECSLLFISSVNLHKANIRVTTKMFLLQNILKISSLIYFLLTELGELSSVYDPKVMQI